VVEIVAPGVDELLGHPPRSFLSWAEDHVGAFG
jgi:hypothetical protein